jgi:sodium/pantothenate symporter
MCAVAFIVLGLSMYLPPNVFWIMLFIGTVFASSWGAVGFMSVWSKTITADGAFWGLTVGLLGNIIPAGLDYAGVIALPSYLNPALLGTVASVTAIILVSRRQAPSDKERQYLRSLHETPAEDLSREMTRTTLIAPALLILYGLVMPLLLLNFYVVPYQRGSGTLGVEGGINWGEVEAWLAFGPLALFAPLGIIAAVTIWRRYYPRAITAGTA